MSFQRWGRVLRPFLVGAGLGALMALVVGVVAAAPSLTPDTCPASTACQHFWEDGVWPSTAWTAQSSGGWNYQLGGEYELNVDGLVYGVGFRKSSTASAPATRKGWLWNAGTGAQLGECTFSGEGSAVGWYYCYFASPVAVAQTTLVRISYQHVASSDTDYSDHAGDLRTTRSSHGAASTATRYVQAYYASPGTLNVGVFPTSFCGGCSPAGYAHGVDILWQASGPTATPTPSLTPTPTYTPTLTPTRTNTPTNTPTGTPVPLPQCSGITPYINASGLWSHQQSIVIKGRNTGCVGLFQREVHQGGPTGGTGTIYWGGEENGAPVQGQREAFDWQAEGEYYYLTWMTGTWRLAFISSISPLWANWDTLVPAQPGIAAYERQRNACYYYSPAEFDLRESDWQCNSTNVYLELTATPTPTGTVPATATLVTPPTVAPTRVECAGTIFDPCFVILPTFQAQWATAVAPLPAGYVATKNAQVVGTMEPKLAPVATVNGQWSAMVNDLTVGDCEDFPGLTFTLPTPGEDVELTFFEGSGWFMQWWCGTPRTLAGVAVDIGALVFAGASMYSLLRKAG